METSGGGDRSLQRASSNRTLFDVVENESMSDGKRRWREFKEKLRLHRSGSGHGSSWTSTMQVPTSDIPMNHRQNANAAVNNASNNQSRMMARRPSTRFPQSDESEVPDVDMDLKSNRGGRGPGLQRTPSKAVDRNASRGMDRNLSRASGRFEHTNSLSKRRSRDVDEHEDDNLDKTPKSAEDEDGEDDEEEDEEENEDSRGGGGEKHVSMSLMALLAETEGSAYTMEEEDEDDDEDDGEGRGVEYNNCCICLVRHKGAASSLCGHTFCRLCSRELYVQRGNCPLCNNYILEILDIF